MFMRVLKQPKGCSAVAHSTLPPAGNEPAALRAPFMLFSIGARGSSETRAEERDHGNQAVGVSTVAPHASRIIHRHGMAESNNRGAGAGAHPLRVGAVR